MSPRRPVFRCLLPLLFTLGFCGPIFADNGQTREADESVKMPNPLRRVVADDDFADALACEGPCEDCASTAGAPSTSESLLWMRAPFWEDFEIEQLYLGEVRESQEWATLRMQRAVLRGENLALWERDEAEPDLFAELAAGVSGFAESALRSFVLRRATDSATGPSLATSVASAFRFDVESLLLSQGNFPSSHFGASVVVAPVFPSPYGYSGSPRSPTYASERAPNAAPTASFSPSFGTQSVPAVLGSSLGGAHWSIGSGTDARLGMAGAPSHKPANEADWWEIVSAAPTKDNVLTDDRFLASIKLDGVGQTWDKEGRALGKVIDLNGYSLTFTAGGILSVGARRNWIHNGTLATMSDNFEVHVLGTALTGGGGLEISAVLANAARGKTGLIKTGDGELILSSGGNTLKGDVHIKGGTLTLRPSGGNLLLPGDAIYVGDGTALAVLNLSGGTDSINPDATVTLRGSERAPAVLRLEKAGLENGTAQTLRKLVIEGSGIIDFSDSRTLGASGSLSGQNALYLDELDLRGKLTLRGWDPHTTKLLINYTGEPDDMLLSKIHIEGYENLRVRRDGTGYWSIAGDPIPEPATCGAIVAAGAGALATWRRGRRLRSSAQQRQEVP